MMKYWLFFQLLMLVAPFTLKCSAKATDEYELARKKVAAFINAAESREIVFTRNATEAINLVAYSWGFANLKPGDEVCLFNSCWLFKLRHNLFSFFFLGSIFY